MPETKKSSWRISSKKISDLKVVVLCILAATTFWILNALNKDNYNTIVDYPIQWEFDRTNYIPVKPLPESIQIQISGNGWDLLRKYFNLNEPPFSIILAEPSSRKFILSTELKRPLGEFITPTQLESLLEDSIHFQIDKIVTKSLTPYLDSAGYSLGKNIEIDGAVLFTPNQITLTGPSSLLESFEGKFPVYLNENRIEKNFSRQVKLELEKKIEDLIQIQETEVEVSFSVFKYLEGNKRLKLKKVNFPRTVTLENEELIPILSYLVDERKVNELKEIEFEAILNYGKRNREDSTIQVDVVPKPDFLKDLKIDPIQVKLKYE
ncbi:MAG: YbbR-like domain-containing protein [Algoriphagus aquaeductus]|uniref:YbbR-like domain-containing protein n=1 Tax=Algoriphagus aquaeductus TaxID=475299 RepID=UPI00387A82FF